MTENTMTETNQQAFVVGSPERQVMPTAVAWLYPDGRPCALSWAGHDEVRMHEMAASQGLIRQELFAHLPPIKRPVKRTPLVESGLDCRTVNCLRAEGFEYVEDAQKMKDNELRRIPNFGRMSLARLREWTSNAT